MKRFLLIWILILTFLLTAGCDTNGGHAEHPSENGGTRLEEDGSQSVGGDENSSGKTDDEPEEEKLPPSADAQEDAQNQLQTFLEARPSYQLGVNAYLEGDVQVHLFFIDDNESQWDEKTIEEFTQKQISLGFDFLESEAERYGQSLDFSIKSYATVFDEGLDVTYDGIIEKGVGGAHSLDLHKWAARLLGYRNEAELYDDLLRKTDCQEVILLFAVNKDGVSYAWHQVEGSIYYPTVEFATIFTNYLGKNFTFDDITYPAAALAHEILHLYGAEDLYTPNELKQMIKDIYPRDIMLLDYVNIEEMNVGEYIAYAIGWLNRAPTVPK